MPHWSEENIIYLSKLRDISTKSDQKVIKCSIDILVCVVSVKVIIREDLRKIRYLKQNTPLPLQLPWIYFSMEWKCSGTFQIPKIKAIFKLQKFYLKSIHVSSTPDYGILIWFFVFVIFCGTCCALAPACCLKCILLYFVFNLRPTWLCLSSTAALPDSQISHWRWQIGVAVNGIQYVYEPRTLITKKYA